MSPLISTQALAERLAGERGRLRIFDATVHLRPGKPGPYTIESGRADYEAAHIPSAAFVDLQRDLSDVRSTLNFTMPAAAQLEAALSASGLSNGDDCVLYSTTSPMWATRLWWMLKSLGFDAQGARRRPRRSGAQKVAPGQRHGSTMRPADSAPPRAARSGPTKAKCCARSATTRCARSTRSAPPCMPAARKPTTAARATSRAASTCPTPRCSMPMAASSRPRPCVRSSTPWAPWARHVSSATAAAASLQRWMPWRCSSSGHPDIAVYDGSMSEWVRDASLPMALGS